MNPLLIKFIACYAIFAVFLAAFAQWSEAGEEVEGWNAFTSTLTGGPQDWFFDAPAPPAGARFGDAFSTYYGDLEVNATDHCSAAYSARDLDVFEPQQRVNVLVPEGTGLSWHNGAPGSAVLTWAEGDWTAYIYLAVGVTGTYSFRVGVWLGSGTGGECVDTKIFSYNQTVSLTARADYLDPNGIKDVITYHVKVNHQIVENDYGGLILTMQFLDGPGPYNIAVWTGPDIPLRIATPPASLDTCAYDVFCSVGRFFGTIIGWIVFIFLGIAWVISVVFITLAWLVVVSVMFFGGLFALSFSGIFGPAGAIIGVFTIVFLAYLILTMAYWIRGSGSIGV